MIPRNSSFIYKGRAVDLRQVARELAAGRPGAPRRRSLKDQRTVDRRRGSRASLCAQFRWQVADIFDVQDEITQSVVAVVEPHIQHAELERSRQKRPESLDADDLHPARAARHTRPPRGR